MTLEEVFNKILVITLATVVGYLQTIQPGKSFSALKYLKNYLRSKMIEDRLNGLAHLYINRDIELAYGKVIEEFEMHNRRLAFV
jgi:hypothetical protein